MTRNTKKRRVLIVIWIMSMTQAGLVTAQATDGIISEIRNEYQDIRKNFHTYDTTAISIWDESAEGGHGVAYWDDNRIKLIEVIWLGEMGKRKIEYYFNGGQLFFVFNTDFEYNRPIYWDEERAKEINDTESFDSEKTVIKENRYYFHDGKLIRWIDENMEVKEINASNSSEISSELKAHADEMREKLKK